MQRSLSARHSGQDPVDLVTALLNHFHLHARDLPWRRTRDPYAIWVSEIMLQQTQVAAVIPYYQRWMTALPNLKALARATPAQVLKLWAGLGYYNRARQLHRAARHLHSENPRSWPQSPDLWQQLPGVGPYTAGAVCSIAFNLPTPVLDGNIARVLSRLHAIHASPQKSTTRNRLWRLSAQLVETAATLPDPHHTNCGDLNQALMELGATLCTPRAPRCPRCPIRHACAARIQGSPERYPHPTPRKPTTQQEIIIALFNHRGRYLVQPIPRGRWNHDLWEFPTFAPRPAKSGKAPAPGIKAAAPTPAPLFELTHVITHHRFRVRVVHFRGQPNRAQIPRHAKWLSLSRLASWPLSGLHRKIAARLRDAALPPRPLNLRAETAPPQHSARTARR
jgi:A/G-specific adenine glycosylase